MVERAHCLCRRCSSVYRRWVRMTRIRPPGVNRVTLKGPLSVLCSLSKRFHLHCPVLCSSVQHLLGLKQSARCHSVTRTPVTQPCACFDSAFIASCSENFPKCRQVASKVASACGKMSTKLTGLLTVLSPKKNTTENDVEKLKRPGTANDLRQDV